MPICVAAAGHSQVLLRGVNSHQLIPNCIILDQEHELHESLLDWTKSNDAIYSVRNDEDSRSDNQCLIICPAHGLKILMALHCLAAPAQILITSIYFNYFAGLLAILDCPLLAR